MSNCGTENESRAGVEVTKDKNGIDQVVLRNQRGASARVRFFDSRKLLTIKSQATKLAHHD